MIATNQEMDLPAYLSGKGIHVYKAAGAEVTMHCLFCPDGDPKAKGKMYVNTESGLWSCKRCDAHGNRKLLLRHFGDEDDARFEFTPGTNPAMRRKALAEATELASDMLYNNPSILEYLVGRGLSLTTIVDAKLGFAPATWSLVRELRANNTYADLRQAGISSPEGGDFFSGSILIPYVSHGDVVQLRGKNPAPGGKYITPANDNARLYNAGALLGARDAFICEGEMDCLIVQQFLRTSTDPNMRDIAVVGLPGANALPTSFASYFENCRKVYIGLDPDPVGEKAADRIKEMLGTKARVVHLPGGLPKVDWTDYLRPKSDDYPHGGHELRDIERLIFEAEAEGRRLFTVRDAFQKWQKVETEVGGVQLGFRDLDTWIAPGLKPGQLCVPLAKTGAGKGSPLSEEICTPNGWQKWGDLQVGDEVFGRDGTPTVVTGIFDRGILPTYRVSFSDHSSLLVDGDHIWCVRQRGGHFSEWIESTMTTTELLTAELKLAPYANGRSRGWHYTIPMAAPIQYPKRHLPIEPYTLGALIANGGLTNGSAQISTPDRAVIERIRRHYDIPAWSPVLAQAGGYCPHAVVRGLIGEIRHLGLDVKSGEKFIPTDYLRGSVDQRVALLQGLMDGDGSARDKGRASVTYSTISPRLARDIRQLVTSLGGTASVRWYPNRRVGRAGRPDEATIGIMLPASIEPFHTPEKRRGSARKHTEPRRAIVSVERVWDQEIRCISVAAADHLYVVGRDHIVTHNTQWLLNAAWNLRDRPTLLCSLEMSAAECYLRLQRIANFWYPLATDVDIAQLLKNLLIYDRGMQQGDLTRVAGDFDDEMGCPPQVVMVDYLGYYANRMRGNSPYERTSQAAIGLKEEAKAGEFVLLAPHQVGRGTAEGTPIELGAARDSGAVEETADLLLSLYKPSDADRTTGDIDGTVRMEVLKNRNGRKNVTTSLNFSLASLVLVDKSCVASKTVDDENALIARGNTYADVRRFRCYQAGKNQQELKP